MADNKVTVMINYQMTEVAKQVLETHVASVLGTVLENATRDYPAFLATEEKLRAFIRQEVQTALADISLAVKLPIPE